ncbi:MAG: hypothetical protein NTV79_10900 [Candidatus Aureabacteria bacterium]|nr:hypothetical protein [Candidatus Auribacterota bacterium]
MKRRPFIRFILTALLATCIIAILAVVLELVVGQLFPAPDHFYIWPPGLARISSREPARAQDSPSTHTVSGGRNRLRTMITASWSWEGPRRNACTSIRPKPGLT